MIIEKRAFNYFEIEKLFREVKGGGKIAGEKNKPQRHRE